MSSNTASSSTTSSSTTSGNTTLMPGTVSAVNPFRQGPYKDLVLMRILMVGFALFCLFFFVRGYLAEAMTLPEEIWNPLLITRILLLPFGWGALPPDGVLTGAFYLAALFGFLSLIGWRTNISLFLFAVFMMLLQAYIYSFGEIHHREAVLMIVLLTLAFSPCGRYWSVDALQGRGFNRFVDSDPNQTTHSEYAYWPIFVCKAFLALMYLSAVFSKMMEAGLGWANGYTLQANMAKDGLRWGSDLAMWFSHQHELLLIAQIVVIVFQLTFWLVLFIPRLSWIYFPIGFAFHVGIYLTLKAPFWHWIMLYVIFIPYTNIGMALRGEIRFKDIFSV